MHWGSIQTSLFYSCCFIVWCIEKAFRRRSFVLVVLLFDALRKHSDIALLFLLFYCLMHWESIQTSLFYSCRFIVWCIEKAYRRRSFNLTVLLFDALRKHTDIDEWLRSHRNKRATSRGEKKNHCHSFNEYWIRPFWKLFEIRVSNNYSKNRRGLTVTLSRSRRFCCCLQQHSATIESSSLLPSLSLLLPSPTQFPNISRNRR